MRINHLSLTKIVSELCSEQHETSGKIIQILKGNTEGNSGKSTDNLYTICENSDNIENNDFLDQITLELCSKIKRY